jgi:uncharacterized protein
MNTAPFLIDEYGDWFFKGSKITRNSMVKLFSTILVRDNDNTFHLRTPVENVLVKVKDAPYLITEMHVTRQNQLAYINFKTNLDINFIVSNKNPLWVEKKINSNDLIPYALVKKGLIAKISRPVYYELAELLDIKNIKNVLHKGVYSGKEFYILDKPSSRDFFLK